MLDRSVEAPPLYAQVARLLAGQINEGKYEPGDLLPSEPGLAKELGVSRATIVKAFDTLHREGLIQRQQGRGTFVAPRPKRHSLSELTSFTSVTRAGHGVPSHRLIDYVEIGAGDDRGEPESVFPVTQELVVLERVRYVDDVAVGYHRTALPADLVKRAGLAKDVVAAEDFSLYQALESIGQRPWSAEESLRAVGCPAELAEHLAVAEGAPLMHVRRLTRNRTGELIEAVDAHYVGSLYEYHTELSSHPAKYEKEGPGHESTMDRGGDVRAVVAERVRRGAGQE
ncbi:GntR family transcriptional regulator [Thermocrispum municipale]|uniref:GntR family transcriptional regulator n=1 Tax=Thermocrispum municipale TaxID=37926 RepID=UPI000413279B|nr:GntR family transcriptional regulator [Thermocrispum municipale]